MVLVYREADLDKYPQVKKQESKHISLGDLHGNALKLIHILVEEGVVDLNETQYNSLRDIYDTEVNQLTEERLTTFQTIIEQANINLDKAVTLIGDELADRGNNDYFTLLVLKKLHQSKVNLNILLSNHSAEFIRDYEKVKFTGFYKLGRGQGQSLAKMQFLIGKGLIIEGEVREIVEQCYIPKAKAISYTLSPEGDITLFSHAPIGLETVQGLATKFNIPYNDKTPKELIQTIDKINKKVEELFISKQLGVLIDAEGHPDPHSPIPPGTQPLQRLVWNRVVGEELITETSTGIKVNFVHGHIGDGKILKFGQPLPSHQNLDTSWAKFPDVYKTGPNSLLGKDVKHFTRHSNDLTALELTDSIWKTIQLKVAKKQFDGLCIELKEKTIQLIAKGTPTNPEFDANYVMAAKAAEQLHKEINDAEKIFFNKKLSKTSIDEFAGSIQNAARTANKEFVNHRGLWHGGGNPLVSFIKGVLEIFDKIIFAIPNVIGALAGKNTLSFFKATLTESTAKLNSFEQGFNELLKEIEPDGIDDDLDKREEESTRLNL